MFIVIFVKKMAAAIISAINLYCHRGKRFLSSLLIEKDEMIVNSNFFNVDDFRGIDVNHVRVLNSSESMAYDSVSGDQREYDVFLSHSTKDALLIQKIKFFLEKRHKISVYIDWIEDKGTGRDGIADTVKSAMNRSESFLIVKTSNSDASSWVSWETGYFDCKDANKIGVFLVEDPKQGFTHATFKHREYLKKYLILERNDIPEFIKNGSSGVYTKRMAGIDSAFRENNIDVSSKGGLQILTDGSGSSTRFYGG